MTKIPHLLSGIAKSDSESEGHPELPSGCASDVSSMLERVLVDPAGLIQYFGCLSAAVDIVRHRRRLCADTVRLVIEAGLAGLPDSELARLALNAVALKQLYDAIQDQRSDYWLLVYERENSVLLEERTTESEGLLSNDGKEDLQHCIRLSVDKTWMLCVEKQGWNPEVLAARSGLEIGTVTDGLHGRLIHIRKARQLAKALGVTLAELIWGPVIEWKSQRGYSDDLPAAIQRYVGKDANLLQYNTKDGWIYSVVHVDCDGDSLQRLGEAVGRGEFCQQFGQTEMRIVSWDVYPLPDEAFVSAMCCHVEDLLRNSRDLICNWDEATSLDETLGVSSRDLRDFIVLNEHLPCVFSTFGAQGQPLADITREMVTIATSARNMMDAACARIRSDQAQDEVSSVVALISTELAALMRRTRASNNRWIDDFTPIERAEVKPPVTNGPSEGP